MAPPAGHGTMAVMGLAGFHSPAIAGALTTSRAISEISTTVHRRLFTVFPSLKGSAVLGAAGCCLPGPASFARQCLPPPCPYLLPRLSRAISHGIDRQQDRTQRDQPQHDADRAA
ncbi:MAG: hypothetical protein MZV64_70820 [Ignavibacteriales bacterium]|nr:hypothetical protein [Ignavibacteriales bacterium]